MLTVYVLPPAFGLPSIDPECLAIITYMKHAVPRGQWELVSDVYGVGNGTTGDWAHLPVLWDGQAQINGYLRIVDHLKEISGGSWSLKTGADDMDWLLANNVQSRISPLLSLLFYTSSDNYDASIRPAFGKELPFPSSWVLPHNCRSQQQERAEMAQFEITASQLSVLATSMTDKPRLAAPDPLSSRNDPLTDQDILNLYPKERIPKENSPSAVIEAHRQLKKIVTTAFSVYQEKETDVNTPSVHTCTLFAHLGLAIAAAHADMPLPWLTGALQSQSPRLIKQAIKWLHNEYEWTAADLATSKANLLSLPWSVQEPGIVARSLALTTGIAQLSGLDQLRIPKAMFTRSIESFADGHVQFKEVQPRGKPLGHNVDTYWLGTTGIVVTYLVYQAWREGL